MKRPQHDFKKLQKAWYAKLKSAGFEDIEDTRTELLKVWHSYSFQRDFSKTQFEATLDYFSLAKDFLNRHSFKDEFEKEIWRLHTEGLDIREIAAQTADFISRFPLFVSTGLYFKRGIVSKTKIHELVCELRRKMRYDD